MKKLLLILIMFFAIGANAQTVKYDFVTTATIPTYTIGIIDTSWVFYNTANRTATFQVQHDTLVGTLDCIFKIQGTLDATNWFDLNMASYTPSSASDVQVFHIPWGTGTDYDQVRILFDRNSISSGTIIISARLNSRR